MSQLLRALHYDGSPNYLQAERGDLDQIPQYAHVFRRAVKGCSLRGVYVLRPTDGRGDDPIVPTVYVCRPASEGDAQIIHRRVYNQSVVPFLLVESDHGVRLYPGFDPPDLSVPTAGGDRRGIFNSLIAFNEVASRLEALRAESIDDGTVWRQLGEHVKPDRRVDWRLLGNLEALDDWLAEQGFDRDSRHALIGKNVYLRYLRQRDILSDRKLAEWNITADSVFSRDATVAAFIEVTSRLDAWLNGSVFPVGRAGIEKLQDDHVRFVAGIFAGDQTVGHDRATVQLALDFLVYDFSYIPVETLSVVYEKFLHSADLGQSSSKGKEQGAYYTPVPLVDFMLAELDERLPLKPPMRVLDPACGSGAFLVQCYRRLIERERTLADVASPDPARLREILVTSVFGVDSDSDACRVAELSLILALLDNIEPPDLYDRPGFLPNLRNANIYWADFFDPNGAWQREHAGDRFEWVVGNPPWRTLKSTEVPRDPAKSDAWPWINVWRWMNDPDRQGCRPTGGHQVAEAFAWVVAERLSADGVAGLLLPAMTLFKDESRGFRAGLFDQLDVWCVANFANFAYVLFSGRSQIPAAAVFYGLRCKAPALSEAAPAHSGVAGNGESVVTVYTPLLVNQEAVLLGQPRSRREAWSIVVNASEVRDVPVAQVSTGEMLPWKVAMWGSHRDERLLRRLSERFPSLASFAATHDLLVSEGFQLRTEPKTEAEQREREFVPDIVGRLSLDMGELRRMGRIFSFPETATSRIPADNAYLRIRGGRKGLEVSHPPHIIVDASRRYAVFSEAFLAVPPRQIGIAGHSDNKTLLQALAAYLNSDFVTYHQFFLSPEWGVQTNRATKDALDALPVPLQELDGSDLEHLADLQVALVEASDGDASTGLLVAQRRPRRSTRDADSLLRELNDRIYQALGTTPIERSLVGDFVSTRLQLIKGKTASRAALPADEPTMQAYLQVLRRHLDSFIAANRNLVHVVVAVYDSHSAMVSIDLADTTSSPPEPCVWRAGSLEAYELDTARRNLLRRHGQWTYFNRNLRVYAGSRVYLMKPRQALHWTTTQASLDAGEIVAETLMGRVD